MFGLGRSRFTVSTLLLAVDARAAPGLAAALQEAQARILEAQGAFEESQEEATRAVSLLLEHQGAWHAAALDGVVFKAEEDAGDHGANTFAQLSARYQDLPEVETPRWLVVGLTVAVRGEEPALGRPVLGPQDVTGALTAMLAAHHKDHAALWHLHVVPLGDDADVLLARFPELVEL